MLFRRPQALLGDGSFYLNPLNPSYSRVVDGSTGRATVYHSKEIRTFVNSKKRLLDYFCHFGYSSKGFVLG
uniref:Methyltransferase n=1 Tax=Caenorhabditis tropicalis TaxID=1561998 RepID=A0A1I7TC32_9PELO